MTEKELLGYACEQFLGKSVMEIKSVILQTLEGHLRAILGGYLLQTIWWLCGVFLLFVLFGICAIWLWQWLEDIFSPSWHIGPICQCVWFYSNVLQDHDFWGTKHTDRSSRHANCWADLPRQRQICLLGTRGGSTWCWPHGYRDSQLHHQGIRKRTSSSCYSDSIFQIFVCLLFNFIRLTA